MLLSLDSDAEESEAVLCDPGPEVLDGGVGVLVLSETTELEGVIRIGVGTAVVGRLSTTPCVSPLGSSAHRLALVRLNRSDMPLGSV
jgi:hypothetical protein